MEHGDWLHQATPVTVTQPIYATVTDNYVQKNLMPMITLRTKIP